MDNIFFCNSFNFRNILSHSPRHNDNSHGIECCFFAFMRQGHGRIVTAQGEEMTLSAGDVFYLPRGLKYHSYWYPCESGCVGWDSYGFVFLPSSGEARFKMQKIKADPEALDLLSKVEMGAPTPESVGYFYLFASRVMPKMERDFADPHGELLERIRSFIRANLDFTVPELARFCGMSESSLYGFFRKTMGKTPVEMKKELQIERAAHLLSSSELSIEEISAQSGFKTAAYFRKVFRSELGISPTEYRKRSAKPSYL